MKKKLIVAASMLFLLMSGVVQAEDACIDCHRKISPGQVKDWEVSRHAEEGVSCDACHGDAHSSKEDYKKAVLPSEQVCQECHEEQFDQFSHGKTSYKKVG